MVTDAWEPQVNGVVRTLKNTARELQLMGHTVEMITPLEFRTLPCPTYPDIRLSILPGAKVTRRLAEFDPDAIHIATEGPLGLAARRFALSRDIPFTTAYHTRFPEYIQARTRHAAVVDLRVPALVPRAVAGRDGADRSSSSSDLEANGFTNVVLWSRGVDLDIFKPAQVQSPEHRSRRSSCTSAAWRWRRTSRPSSRSTCPARSGSPARAPRSPASARAIPK